MQKKEKLYEEACKIPFYSVEENKNLDFHFFFLSI